MKKLLIIWIICGIITSAYVRFTLKKGPVELAIYSAVIVMGPAGLGLAIATQLSDLDIWQKKI